MTTASTTGAVTQSIASLFNSSGASSTSGAASTTGTQATINSAQKSLVSDQTTFLKLLTTQLQHQNPLSPLDTNQFTQQLVSMTGVQQQILSNQLLQQLVNNQSGMGDPVGLLGKTVLASTSQATLSGGAANWLYSTAAAAQDVQLSVTDSLGQVIYKSDAGAAAAGQHAFSWNGKDQNGVQLPDGGVYTLKVAATDSSGSTINTSIYQSGVVSAVNNSSSGVTLNVNGAPLPASSVTSVQAGS